MMFCPDCGVERAKGKFCGECGATLVKNAPKVDSSRWSEIKEFLSEIQKPNVLTPDVLEFNVVTDEQDKTRFKTVVVQHQDFAGMDVVSVLSMVALSDDVAIENIINHPSFQDQPFGLNVYSGAVFISSTVPTDRLELKSLLDLMIKIAWVAEIMASVHTEG